MHDIVLWLLMVDSQCFPERLNHRDATPYIVCAQGGFVSQRLSTIFLLILARSGLCISCSEESESLFDDSSVVAFSVELGVVLNSNISENL
jgi:hypothetical protein